MKRSSSCAQGKMVLANTDDRISNLPKDLLLKILSELSVEEAMRTSVLSKQWVDVWKEKSNLFFNLQKLQNFAKECDITEYPTARSMTKVINDHCGSLERCTIIYVMFQCEKEMVEAWIRTLIHVKQTQHLKLVQYLCSCKPNHETITLDLPLETFSNPNLISLDLSTYEFISPHAFRNCGNLKNLELVCRFLKIEDFNLVLVSCPNLEVLSLNITIRGKSGILKIDNKNLKFLFLVCREIDRIEVSSPSLDIVSIGYLSCTEDNLVISDPRHNFCKDYWNVYGSYTSYNISCHDQEEKSIGHKFIMSKSKDYMRKLGSMSVIVDLKNRKEVKMLQEILVEWPEKMSQLEIVFKNNNAPERDDKEFREEEKPFPDACFKVDVIYMMKFSGSKEEYALASRLITQKTTTKRLVINPFPISSSHELEIQTEIYKLAELRNCDPVLDIIMVYGNFV
ncbi:unnamed protein product [Cochlearia groenlandica]